MFGIQKKSAQRRQWHPDFRIVERLPDTKIIRTRFLINFIGISIFCLLLAYTGYQELAKMGLRQSIAAYEAESESRLPVNRRFAAMSGQFRQLANQLEDLKQFESEPVDPAQLLVELARMRTADVVYDRISYDHVWDNALQKEVYKVELSGKGRTTADIGELKNRLSILEVDEGYAVTVAEEGNPTKDIQTGVFSFVIILNISEVENGDQ